MLVQKKTTSVFCVYVVLCCLVLEKKYWRCLFMRLHTALIWTCIPCTFPYTRNVASQPHPLCVPMPDLCVSVLLGPGMLYIKKIDFRFRCAHTPFIASHACAPFSHKLTLVQTVLLCVKYNQTMFFFVRVLYYASWCYPTEEYSRNFHSYTYNVYLKCIL